MKNAIVTAIGILAFIAVISMMAACSEVQPVDEMTCDDVRDALHDSRMMEETAWQYAESLEVSLSESENDTGSEFATIDWQARAEFAESEVLNVRGQLSVCTNKDDVQQQRITELRNALRYFDVKTSCENLTITTQWICEAALSDNL